MRLTPFGIAVLLIIALATAARFAGGTSGPDATPATAAALTFPR